MEKTITVSGKNFPVSLHKATVIHADKFTRTSGGMHNLPVRSTLYTDVVFRIDESNEDWPLYIKYIDLVIYKDQRVLVIVVNDAIVGFVDEKTGRYYYTTTQFSKLLKLGIHYTYYIIAGIAGAVILYLAYPKQFGWVLIPLVIALIAYQIQKLILSSQARKAIDSFLEGDR